MINQITCNSNNAIELSRGELLNWLNALLRINYSKIQQLGTGAAYCQLLDIIYPGKVPLTKVNWKAKFDYEYLNNFKVLQQSFTKLNIMKHIDVEKLVKCKYQDNLEFLQWFKKIFDTTGSHSKQYDAITRRGDKLEKEKENKNPLPLLSSQFSAEDSIPNSKEGSYISSNDNSKQSTERIMQSEAKQIEAEPQIRGQNYSFIEKYTSPSKSKVYLPGSEKVDEKLAFMFNSSQNEDKQFYLRKLKEIEYLMDTWDTSKKSEDLIENIRRIILVTPLVEWNIEDGVYLEGEQQ